MLYLGIDPSVQSCGVCIVNEKAECVLYDAFGYALKKGASDLDRLKRSLDIVRNVMKMALEKNVDVVAIEGLGISSKFGRIGNQFQLAELLGIFKTQIYLTLKKVPIIVPPASWKKGVIGKGNADKLTIKKVLEEKGYIFEKQDHYDALGIALYAKNFQGGK